MLTSDMIRQLCQYKGISITELCRRINQSPQNFGKKLKRDTVSLEELGEIAKALNVKYEQKFVMSDDEYIGISYEDDNSAYDISDKVMPNILGSTLLEAMMESAYHVNLETGSYIVRFRREWIDQKYERDGDFQTNAAKWINTDVAKSDREKMLYETKTSTIREKLKECETYSVMYESIHTNPHRYQEMKVIRVEQDKDIRYATLCFIDRDDIVRKTKQNIKLKNDNLRMISAVEAMFSMCLYCNITKNEFHIIEGARFHIREKHLDGDYDELIAARLDSLPYEYRAIVLDTFNRDALKKAYAEGKNEVELIYPQTGDDGILRYILTCHVFQTVENGDLTSVVFSRNVTEEVERELKADKKEELLPNISKSCISVYIVHLDNDTYEILHMNPDVKTKYDSLYELFEGKGYTDAINTFVDMGIHPDYIEKMRKEFLRDTIRETLLQTDSYARTYRESSPDNLYTEMIVQKLDEKYGKEAVLLSFFNVDEETKRQLSEAEKLAKALEDAEKANRAKQEFLYNMSRDLRTPMNAIVGLTEMAMRNQDNPIKMRNCLEKLRMTEDTLMQLMNDVLLMSQLDTGVSLINEAKVNIPDEAMKVMSSVKDVIIAKKLHFNFLTKTIRDKDIYADSMHVNRIMLAIFDNAVKFTPPGGTIVHTIEQLDDGEDNKARYCFTVEDNGLGISENFIDSIYEPFSREKRIIDMGIPGIGMGLCIAHTLADLMGGHIEAESKEGAGSIFRVYLSFNKADATMPTDMAEFKASNYIKGKNILVVEDNELNREITRDILEKYGMRVTEAINGQDAMDILATKDAENIDAVLMDIHMPVMDGYETTQNIRKLKNKKLKRIPVIALTVNLSAEDKNKAMEAGMDAYLEKPIVPEKLIRAIESVL